MLLSENGPRFRNVYIYSKSLFQPKYRYLKKVLKGIKGINLYLISDFSKVLPPCKCRRDSIVIFDDIAPEDRKYVSQYFTMGRHFGLNPFFLCQSYSSGDKHSVKDNANFLIIFRQDELNLLNIYKNHVIGDMSFKKFLHICGKCWRDNDFSFLVIDKDAKINSGRYRMGYNNYIQLSKKRSVGF